ncbi:hypothetical protein GW17_00060712 [Ensete ventricosum]|nr:hypothetical protein GW17_00060712 [Ensete ventricosum]
MLQRANQYVIAEALVAEKCKDQKHPQAESSQGRPPALSRKRIERTEQAIPGSQRPTQLYLDRDLPPDPGERDSQSPHLMRTQGHDHGHYYCFHRDYGHDTKECYDLKNQIEGLIRWGHLDQFIRKLRELFLHPKGLVERQIDVIVGGPTAGGDNSLVRLRPTQKSKRDPKNGRSYIPVFQIRMEKMKEVKRPPL